MKVLIIGGTGFIGRHVTRQLAAVGHEVRVYARGEREAALPENVRRINAELSSLAAYAEVLRKLAFDVVIHMIAMTKNEAAIAAETFAGHAGRAVVISSQDVYAVFGALLGKEQLEARPGVAVGEDGQRRSARYIRGGEYEKLDVEWEFARVSEQLPVVILRLPAIYGPHDNQRRFYPFIKRMFDKRSALLLDPDYGNFRWSHGYVENVAHAITLAATHEGANNKVYNVAEPRTPTVAERLHTIARAAGYRGQVIVTPREKFPKHLLREANFQHDLVFDDRAIRKELGYDEIVSVEEGWKRTLDWQTGNPPEKIDPAEFDYPAEDAILADLGLLPKAREHPPAT